MKTTMKPEKYSWNEKDFDEMGWHDNRVHAMIFEKDFVLSFSIDYIYQWEKKLQGYWVAPAKLSFQNVSSLIIAISFQDMVDLIIEDISISNRRNTPNGVLLENEYLVKTNVGEIVFFSTGFEMELQQDPEFSQYQDLKTQRSALKIISK